MGGGLVLGNGAMARRVLGLRVCSSVRDKTQTWQSGRALARRGAGQGSDYLAMALCLSRDIFSVTGGEQDG